MAKNIGVEATVLAEFGLPLADGAYADAFGYAGDIVLFRTVDAVDAAHRKEDLDFVGGGWICGGEVYVRFAFRVPDARLRLGFQGAESSSRQARCSSRVFHCPTLLFPFLFDTRHEDKTIGAIMPWCLKCTQNQMLGLPDLPTSATP